MDTFLIVLKRGNIPVFNERLIENEFRCFVLADTGAQIPFCLFDVPSANSVF